MSDSPVPLSPASRPAEPSPLPDPTTLAGAAYYTVGHSLKVGAATPALEAELVSALRELNNAALDARPYVAQYAGDLPPQTGPSGPGYSGRALERLDAAIADAGELLAKVPA